jgi:hypothetical protein
MINTISDDAGGRPKGRLIDWEFITGQTALASLRKTDL